MTKQQIYRAHAMDKDKSIKISSEMISEGLRVFEEKDSYPDYLWDLYR